MITAVISVLLAIGLGLFILNKHLNKSFSKAFSNVLDFDLASEKEIIDQACMRDE